MKKYDLSDIKHFNAPYLERGFREEVFELKEFYYDDQKYESLAKFEVIQPFSTPNEPAFYLDSLAAIRLFYQAVVTTICLEQNVQGDRDFPLFSRTTSINCKRFIYEKNIDIRCKLIRKKELKNGTYCHYAMDICNGAFTGEFKLMLHPYSFYEWKHQDTRKEALLPL